MVVLYCGISFLVGLVVMFFIGAKFRKSKTEYVVDEELMDEIIEESIQEQLASMRISMLKIPIELRNYDKIDAKKQKKCEDCARKAESLGVDIKVACPDLDCDDEEDDDNYTVEKTNDYVRPEDIKGFLPIKDGVNVAFYSGEVIRYNIKEKDFIKKVEDFIQVV